MKRRLAGAVALAVCAGRLALAADPSAAPPVALPAAPEPPRHRAAAALALGGAYVTWGVAEWLVLYHDKQQLPFSVGSEGWFSDTSYAGGADKFGHMWANLTYSRIGTDVLRLGGWDTLPASLLSSGLSFGFFFLVEVKDGLFHVFSYSDLAGNAAGELPGNTTFFVEDYSGQSYLFALKLRALRAIREGRWGVRWLELINPVIGFQTRSYKPVPRPPDVEQRRQQIFVGLTVDLQALADELLGGATSRPGRWGHKVAHTVTEYLNAPCSTLQANVASRSPSPD